MQTTFAFVLLFPTWGAGFSHAFDLDRWPPIGGISRIRGVALPRLAEQPRHASEVEVTG